MASNAFGIAGRGDDPFLPYRESDHGDGVLGKHAANFGEIRFAARFIAQVRARDMDAAILQQLERLRAVAVRQHQLHAGGLQMVSQHRDSRVASGDENSIAKVVGGVENLNVGAAVLGRACSATTASLTGKYHGTGEGGEATSRLFTRHSCTGWPGCKASEPGSNVASSERRPVGSACGSEKRSSTFTSRACASRNATAVFGT